MSQLNPDKLHTTYLSGVTPHGLIVPRAYTLTHSDTTGDLFLTIGPSFNRPQISGWYTRLMRDEVLAEWRTQGDPSLHVHCHVSGGLVLGTAGWRDAIFRRHLPRVLEAFRYGDRVLFEANPELDRARIYIHFHASRKKYDRTEEWGRMGNFALVGATNNAAERDV